MENPRSPAASPSSRKILAFARATVAVLVLAAAPARAEGQASGRARERKAWVVRGVATAVYAGATTAAFVARDDRIARQISTVAGVAGGVMAADLVLGSAYAALSLSGHESEAYWVAYFAALPMTFVGGVLGGQAAHALAASPGARGPVTAVGLAPAYLLTISMTID